MTIPKLPFEGFKWKWASFACTEGLNDPLYLLGVLYRLYKLEDGKTTFSSPEFASEMYALEQEVRGRTEHDVNISGRVGERNLMRNSKQYWTALGLLANTRSGVIELTNFGRQIARHNITQTEFAATTVQTFTLPNRLNMPPIEVERWESAGIQLRPLRLLLAIIRHLHQNDTMQGYLTNNELCNVVIPLSGTVGVTVSHYAECILRYREGDGGFAAWPQCCTESNDRRISREFLLFLMHYGFICPERCDGDTNHTMRFRYNAEMDNEIAALLAEQEVSGEVTREMERKRIRAVTGRPHQAAFRKQVLAAYGHCIVTDVEMPEVLEAAHIVPHAYRGEDTVANGFPLRSDIHILFDSGHLRIHPSGELELSDRARANYGYTIRRHIEIPPQVNREFLQWRWDNYSGL